MIRNCICCCKNPENVFMPYSNRKKYVEGHRWTCMGAYAHACCIAREEFLKYYRLSMKDIIRVLRESTGGVSSADNIHELVLNRATDSGLADLVREAKYEFIHEQSSML